ncbi:MAG: DUF4430 domain-containing protein [Thermoleophilia bacterium]|nr:DUF4430 domain-containing protein [Thermoleophilia bacterium]
MRTRTILAAAAFAVAIIVPAQASAAALRVVTPTQTVFGATDTQVGSARAYLDSKGQCHALKTNTALGQLAAAAGWTNTGFAAGYSAGLGAYVTKIGGVTAPSGGYWAMFVNGLWAAVGADSQVLKKTDRVLWIADSDYSPKNGPFVFDLVARDNGDGTVTFTGTKVGGPKATPAAGATLSVNSGVGATLDAKGKATLTLAAPWTAVINTFLTTYGSAVLRYST